MRNDGSSNRRTRRSIKIKNKKNKRKRWSSKSSRRNKEGEYWGIKKEWVENWKRISIERRKDAHTKEQEVEIRSNLITS